MIVPSCDKYSILWEPFFSLKEKYWKDCPFKTYLISENPYHPGAEGIKEESQSWATNLKSALGKIGAPYIYLHLEDMLIAEEVNTKRVVELFEIMKKENILKLGITPFLHETNFSQFREYPDLIHVGTDPYRVSTQLGFWYRETLMQILKEGENIWQTEIDGFERTIKLEPFVMMKDEWVIKVVNSFCQGKITDEGKKFLEKEGFDFPLNTSFKVDYPY